MALFCETCNVHVPSEISMKDHVAGKKHLRLVANQQKQHERADRSVYVRGFSKRANQTQIQSYFSQFGEVENVFYDKERGQYAFVQFADRGGVEATLARDNHVFHGRCLVVKPKEVKTFVPKKKGAPPEKSAEEEQTTFQMEAIMTLLSQCTSVDEQLLALYSQLKLTDADLLDRRQIQGVLQQLFEEFIPSCEVKPFGSSSSGLGTRGCDMDVFLELNLDKDIQNQAPNAQPLPYLADIAGLRFDQGRIERGSLGATGLHERIKVVARLLGHAKRGFTNILTIYAARCPVVKCVHEPTSVRCDLSLNNRLALRNTRLLQLYMALDDRVKPLVFTVRHWAKVKALAGNAGAGPLLTSYALTLLVVFYLQTCRPAVLPCARTLAQLAAPSERVEIDGWDSSFLEDKAQIPASANRQSLCELLEGFFRFYATFDLGGKVVCPATGEAIGVPDFRRQLEVDEKVKAFKMAPLCIQDPFVLDHNTASNVNGKTKVKVASEFQMAAAKIKSDEFRRPLAGPTGNWGLPYLMSSAEVKGQTTDASQASSSREGGAASGRQVYHEVVIPMGLPDVLLADCVDMNAVRETWIRQVAATVVEILTDILGFQCLDRQSHPARSPPHLSSRGFLHGAPEPTDNRSGSPSVGLSPIGGAEDMDTHPGIPSLTADIPASDARNTRKRLSPEVEIHDVVDTVKRCRNDPESCDVTSNEVLHQDKPDGAVLVPVDDDVVSVTSREELHQSAAPVVDSSPSVMTNSDTATVRHSPTVSREDQSAAVVPVDPTGCPGRPPCQWQHLHCHTSHRLYMGRKKCRKEVVQSLLPPPPVGVAPDLWRVETEVSRRLREEQTLNSETPVLTFDLSIHKHVAQGNAAVVLRLKPCAVVKEFSSFFLFFKPFMLRLLEKSLHSKSS